jgi:hypothetical protein
LATKALRGTPTLLVGLLLIGVLFTAYTAQSAIAQTPANKATAVASKVTVTSAGEDNTILAATMKTSKPTDLIMTVSLECAILTKLLTQGSPTAGATSQATTNASVRVWIEQSGRGIVPLNATSEPPQDGSTPNSGDDSDKVTFCQREEGRRVTDAEDPQDGVDTQQTYQETKTANSFTWILLNAGSGTYEYTVHAEIVEAGGTCTPDTTNEQTCSDAWIGNRILVIEPTKMANNATV